jgi:hypothetical protein
MSCPDWRSLAGQRDGRDGDVPGWDAAVAHFDGGCPSCRRAALAAEPTLVFRGLRAAGMSAAREASEVAAVRQAVDAMRTARRVDAIGGRSRLVRRSSGRVRWVRWAAAAALTALSLAVPADRGPRRSEPAPQVAATRPAGAPVRSAAVPAAFAGEADLPTVEGVNRPGARVYHMEGEGLSVVMIVDETLDV